MKLENQNSYYKLSILDGLEVFDAKHHTLNFPFHAHNTFNITLVLEQIFYTKLYNRFLHAPVGTIVVTNPEEVHSTICDNKIGSSFFTFYVSPDVLIELNQKKPVFFADKIINDAMLFKQLFTLSRCINSLKVAMEKKLLKALKRLVTYHSTNSFTAPKNRTYFRRFLEEEIAEKFSLENAANKFGIDKYKFIRLFKYETGLTPNNYIF